MPKNRYSGDVFGKNIADATRNDGDLAGHYPYSQERWRFFETDLNESNRIFLEYNADPRYQHTQFRDGVSSGGSGDVHTISPNAGDTLYFKTAERFKYVVGYESRATWAFGLNQDLQAGDSFELGPVSDFGGDTFQNGYTLYFDSDLGPTQTEMRLYRGGTIQNRATYNLPTPITEFQRMEWRYAWYNIMGCIASQSYNYKNIQFGDIKSDDDQRGPEIGSFNLSCCITAGESTSGLQAYMGSAGWQTWGSVDVLNRTKTVPFTLSYGGSGDYEPLLCIRKDPKRAYIKTEFDQLEVNTFSGQDDFFVIAQVMSAEKIKDAGGNPLDDTDFSVPPEVSAINSVTESTTNVAQFPDKDGNLVTSTADPGGYQVAYSALYAGQGAGRSGSDPREIKRAVNNGDFVVILGRTTGSTSGTVKIEIVYEQDW